MKSWEVGGGPSRCHEIGSICSARSAECRTLICGTVNPTVRHTAPRGESQSCSQEINKRARAAGQPLWLIAYSIGERLHSERIA